MLIVLLLSLGASAALVLAVALVCRIVLSTSFGWRFYLANWVVWAAFLVLGNWLGLSWRQAIEIVGGAGLVGASIASLRELRR